LVILPHFSAGLVALPSSNPALMPAGSLRYSPNIASILREPSIEGYSFLSKTQKSNKKQKPIKKYKIKNQKNKTSP